MKCNYKSKVSTPKGSVKSSAVRERIDSMLHNDPKVQEAIREEARRANLLEAKRQAEDIDALILISLHRIFGFGKKRLLQFVEGLAELQKYYEDRYEDCDIYAMKVHLREQVGIDVAELQKEVEKRATEETTPEG